MDVNEPGAENQPVMEIMSRVFIGLGSNMDDPIRQLEQAVIALNKLPATTLQNLSGIYQSAPMGPADQSDYMNAVAELASDLDAQTLLEHLQGIEQQQDRCRDGQRWTQRTLDLDILLYDDDIIRTDTLTVPHPGMHERSFVLHPLQELDARINIPERGCINDCLKGNLLGEIINRLEDYSWPL